MRTRRLAPALTISLALLAAGCGQARTADFDGSGAADRAWTNNGTWYTGSSTTEPHVLYVGHAWDPAVPSSEDVPVPADYDGDGKVEIAFIRNDRTWMRADGTVIAEYAAPPKLSDKDSVVPVPGYWSGGPKAVPAWYRTSDATWFITGALPAHFGRGATDLASQGMKGYDGDFPVPADYDGDGRTDLAAYRPTTGAWSVRSSRDGSISTTVVRTPRQHEVLLPVAGDFDGVGHAQRSVYDMDDQWYVEGRENPVTVPFDPTRAAAPAAADYDGDGRTDLSAYDYETGSWWVQGSTDRVVMGRAALPAATPFALIANVARITLLSRCAGEPVAC